MSEQSYQQEHHQYRRHGCSWLKIQGKHHTRTLPTVSSHSPCNFRVLLLAWEELWFPVRIIPAEVGLVAGGPGSLWTQGEPCRRTRLNVLHRFLLHSGVKEARSLSKKWGREIGNQKSHGLEIQTRGSGEVCIIHSQMP